MRYVTALLYVDAEVSDQRRLPNEDMPSGRYCGAEPCGFSFSVLQSQVVSDLAMLVAQSNGSSLYVGTSA